ncbi:uncharacterized protein TNCV_5014871 [Trichonephila clavipes]|nr:uncharacterized protein TNCV_5014871 [Trichonephila clavipes]
MSLTWRSPPTHHWYAAKSPGLSLHCRSSRAHQTALTRFRSGHLRSITFVQGDTGNEKKLSERWMETGPILWPPRSLDETPCRNNVKKIAYQYAICNTEKLKNGMRAAIHYVDAAMHHRAWTEISYRLHFCEPND